jgi:hypothetical protein
VVALVATLSACGSPKLDRQQQEATSRECISLLDRRATRGSITVAFRLDGETYDLGRDPAAFYDALREKRGPDAFPVDASSESDTGRQDVVRRKCSGSDPSKSSTKSSSSTTSDASSTGGSATTVTTTSTTAPASTTDG